MTGLLWQSCTVLLIAVGSQGNDSHVVAACTSKITHLPLLEKSLDCNDSKGLPVFEEMARAPTDMSSQEVLCDVAPNDVTFWEVITSQAHVQVIRL